VAWTSTLPPDPIVASWWAANDARAAREAVVADGRRAAEQAKRARQLRRRVERIDEAIVLALSASDARRNLRKQGLPWTPYERSRLGPVEHSHHVGQILSVRR
jgi:hypothetical protein